MAYTITEALQEIKTINKRLEVKRNNVGNYTVRDSRVKDPLEKEGGSVMFVAKEFQSIADLESRIVKIRTAIQKSNLANVLVVNGETKTVAEWLAWRKEVAQGSKNFLNAIATGIKQVRDKLQRDGKAVYAASGEANAQPGDAIVHLDETQLAKKLENHEVTLSELDGKLSLANATTNVEV